MRWLSRLRKPPKKREITPDDIPTPIPRFVVRTRRGADRPRRQAKAPSAPPSAPATDAVAVSAEPPAGPPAAPEPQAIRPQTEGKPLPASANDAVDALPKAPPPEETPPAAQTGQPPQGTQLRTGGESPSASAVDAEDSSPPEEEEHRPTPPDVPPDVPRSLPQKDHAFFSLLSAYAAHAFGDSRRIVIIATGALLVVLVILGGVAYKTGVIDFPQWVKSKAQKDKARPLPPSGAIYIYSAIKPVAPFTIHGHKTMPSMLTLRHKHSRTRAMSVFVHAGSTVETKAPLGDYLVQCGYGMSWYGEDRTFGASGIYIQGKSYLEFWVDKQHRRLWGNTFDIGATAEESSQADYVKISQEDFTL